MKKIFLFLSYFLISLKSDDSIYDLGLDNDSIEKLEKRNFLTKYKYGLYYGLDEINKKDLEIFKKVIKL